MSRVLYQILFSPFGLKLLDSLLIDARAMSCPAFRHQQTSMTQVCAAYLRDVTFSNLMFTNRNVGHFQQHHHLEKAQARLRTRLRQAFCTECREASCFVNEHMLRTVLVHMHYIARVSLHY